MPNCRNLKVAENFAENRKAELWKLKSCGKFQKKKEKKRKLVVKKIYLRKENQLKQQVLPSPNSGLAQLGFGDLGKVGFVLGSWFLIRYIWLTKSPTDAKPRDVVCKHQKKLK